MKINFKIHVLLFSLLFSLTGFAQEKEDSLDAFDLLLAKTLVVYGDGFKYSVNVPKGWMPDTTVSNDLYANIIFYEADADDVVYEKVVIQVYTFKKENDNVKDDLNIDIVNFREEHNNKVEQQDFTIANGDFKCYNKLLFVKDKAYQYLVYLDPGKKYKSGVSVSMNVTGRKPTDAQYKALRRVVTSIKMIKG